MITSLTFSHMNRNTTQEDLKASVETAANKYPQYVGYTNGWNETIALRAKSTKGGLVMLAGDVVLVDGSTEEFGEGRKSAMPFVRVWSARRECPVWVEKSYLSNKHHRDPRRPHQGNPGASEGKGVMDADIEITGDNTIITVRRVSNRGRDYLYPVNATARLIGALMGTKTLTDHAINTLKAYGYTVQIAATEAETI